MSPHTETNFPLQQRPLLTAQDTNLLKTPPVRSDKEKRITCQSLMLLPLAHSRVWTAHRPPSDPGGVVKSLRGSSLRLPQCHRSRVEVRYLSQQMATHPHWQLWVQRLCFGCW